MTERIDDAELERIAREFIATSLGGPDSELSGIRERNLRAYNAEPTGDFAAPEIDDRSQFVSSDVADTVDGMLPQLLDVFVSDDQAVECKPKKPGPEAEAQAKQATGYLNYQFYTKNDGLNVLHDWVWDAATQKMGHVKIWAEEEKEDSRAAYEGLTEDQVALLQQDGAQFEGEPQVDEQGFLSVVVKREVSRIALKVACTPQNEMRIDPNAKWGADPAAIGEVKLKRRFELEEMGYDLSNIGEGSSATRLEGEVDALLGDSQGDIDNEFHESHALYEYAELYFKLDVDGDGVAEWVQVCLVNGNLLSVEQVDDHPYAEICLMPRPHAYHGDCPADRAYAIQREQTNLTRALLDNVYFATNQRTYVNTRAAVNIGDLLDNRPGGIVRGDGTPGDAFAPMPTIPIPQSAWQLQESLSVRLENRTGFTRYSQGMDADALNKTATGINIITSKADMRLRLMTRFAALGVRKMFAKLLKLATRHQDGEEWFEVNGDWTPVRPTEWRDQFTMQINVGLGHGTKEQKMQQTMAMVPLMQMGAQAGVVRPEHWSNLIQLAASVNEFKNPEQFCDDQPSGLPNPQQFQQMQQQMQEMGEKGQQLQQENLKLKADAEVQRVQAARDGLKADVEKAQTHLDAREQTANAKLDARDEAFGAQVSAEEKRKADSASEEQRLDALEQNVAAIGSMLAQLLTQQQGQDGSGMEAGMDAPVAPL